ncbi:MAG TPA: ATP-binding cassette domain-containing protein [Gemmataceae bacterium]|nr:ATP-binding cassette domain-containing protein [Gemmataceae bacterium]
MSTAAPTERPRSSSVRQGPQILRVQGVNHWYGDTLETRKQVLFDNHLSVARGEIVIMTGPSGSGKTTLLTLLGALRSVQEGEVEVLDQKLHQLSGKQLVEVRRNIGFIFQAHNLFSSLTALQNVRMALELRESDRKRIHDRAVEVLTALGLQDRIHYKPSRLSGGQKQRVAIARALANRPKLILADEPTAALDEHSGRDVVNLLKKLAHEEGCTSLIVTHDNRILDVADRIVSMADGHIKSNVLVQEEIEICEFLKQCDVFAHLTTGMLTNIAEEMKTESHPAGTIIIRQGDVGEKFYLIKSGIVDVIVNQGLADEAKVATLGKGQIFGETALLTGEPRNATVIGVREVELYTLDKPRFRSAIAASEPFRKELEKILFQRQ